jgi:hypothetical protein
MRLLKLPPLGDVIAFFGDLAFLNDSLPPGDLIVFVFFSGDEIYSFTFRGDVFYPLIFKSTLVD